MDLYELKGTVLGEKIDNFRELSLTPCPPESPPKSKNIEIEKYGVTKEKMFIPESLCIFQEQIMRPFPDHERDENSGHVRRSFCESTI